LHAATAQTPPLTPFAAASLTDAMKAIAADPPVRPRRAGNLTRQVRTNFNQ
jgi:hypothetical protein